MSLPAYGTQNRQAIQPRKTFQAHAYRVNCIIHVPGGQQIMTCSIDGLLRVWNLESGRQIGNDWRDGERGVYRIALSPDWKKIIISDGDGVVRLRDIDSGKVITEWTNKCSSVCWSQDGGRILSGSFDGIARVWDVENGETILEINTELSHVRAVIYSPDETMIATGGSDDMEKEFLKIWDVKTGKLVKNLKGHTDDVTGLAWTADGSKLISGSHDFSIRTWNTITWRQIAICIPEHTNLVLAITISPNGHILASASFDGTVRLWNLENGHLIGPPLQDLSQVTCFSFSSDGKLLATGCENGNVEVWDISAIEDGYNELLMNDVDKLILNVRRRRVCWSTTSKQ